MIQFNKEFYSNQNALYLTNLIMLTDKNIT